MRFEMWSWYHYLYIVSPFIALLITWAALRKSSDKTRYRVGVVIGALSLLVLLTRNIDILVRGGFHPEAIPLQVCHFGNIAVFVALVFRNKTAAALAWCLNVIPAFASLIVADALAGYSTVAAIRPQAYIWGHFFIVFGAMYAVLFRVVFINQKAFFRAFKLASVLALAAIVFNTYFNDYVGTGINYFYIYDSDGVPFEMFYRLSEPLTIGSWFTFNPLYVLSVLVIGLVGMTAMYYLQKWYNRRHSQLPTA